MKTIKILLVAITLLTASFTANAQVAHINSEELVSIMPETKAMQDALKVLGQSYDTEYKAQESALQVKIDGFKAKVKRYGEESTTTTKVMNETREKEVLNLQQEIGAIQQKLQLYLNTAREEMQNKERELLSPIIMKAQKAIEDVAKDKGVKYVMDSARGKGLIVFEGEDLLQAVKTNLGL